MTTKNKYTNVLISESSPYLLQHAHNPVNWMPWGAEALEKAKTENKPLLISVGYSACHWCHVMEHESFEDEQVAQIMNAFFVCIKVDREERPDIDQIYMDAVQLMTRQGGWPLNCFALPDGRPFYGGTYFPKSKWIDILKQINQLYTQQHEKVLEYAQNLTEGLTEFDMLPQSNVTDFESETLHQMAGLWQNNFDHKDGGPNRAPKFMMPNTYSFLLSYGHFYQNSEVLNHVNLTLETMAKRGIYDWVGGGFSRYSTDIYWKVPHFEKMLYDNAQLISLYSNAFVLTGNEHYKQIVDETIAFCLRELADGNGYFFSALDADSEGEEGKYYIWSKPELKEILKENYQIFEASVHIDDFGVWENNNYILMPKNNATGVGKNFSIAPSEVNKVVAKCKQLLLKHRQKRVPPGLDDKTLTSWNALMVTALVDAYKVTQNNDYFFEAQKTLQFIIDKMTSQNGGLMHTYKNGVAKIEGYLEDYCFTIEALIGFYEISANEQYLLEAKNLTNYTLDYFFDNAKGYFFFTSSQAEKLITRKKELTDDVIPASNSTMAKNLFKLGLIFNNESYSEIAKKMVLGMVDQMKKYPAGYANWALAYLFFTKPFFEIAIAGKGAKQKMKQLTKSVYLPNAIYLVSENPETKIPLLKNKFQPNDAQIYICVNQSCKMPVSTINQAVEQINSYL